MTTSQDKNQGQKGGNGSIYASKTSIMLIDDLVQEEVVVPEWNGMIVRVRQLTGTERGYFEGIVTKVSPGIDKAGMSVQMDPSKMRVTLVGLTIVDESGKRLFSDQEIDALGSKSAKAIERIYNVSAKLSGLTNESMEEVSDLSTAAHSSVSTSDSASN